MKFTCSKSELISAASNVSGAISPSSIAALEGYYIRTVENQLYIGGYNLDLGISTLINAKVEVPGDIVLNASLFLNIVRKLPDEVIYFESDDKNIAKIKSGETEYSVISIPGSEFPEMMRVVENKKLSIPESTLKTLIRQTKFAVAKDGTNPIYTGILFEMKNKKITAMAVDGYRLAMSSEDIGSEEESRFIVPEKTLSEIMKMLGDDSEENVEIIIGNRTISFEINGYTFISRTLDGEFRDYRSSIPTDDSTVIKVKTKSIRDLIDRISPVVNDRLMSPMRLIFADNQIKASCSTAIGTASDRISAEILGARVEIGFSNRYLLEALRACESDEIKIVLSGPLSPMKILPSQGDGFLFLVLPVRLKTENI